MLREAVAGICAGFGPEYMRGKIAASEPPSELWDALAERGYLGVNVPEEYDGGGRGLTELAAVGEEVARAGCAVLLIVVSPCALYDAGARGAGEASNMAKYAAAEAAIAAVDAAIQAHGGNGLASEYGLMPYWGLARLLRIAPVNREMILNYVAQHSLGLPRSY